MFDKLIAILSNEGVFIICWFLFLILISNAVFRAFFLKSIKGKKLNELEEKYPKGTAYSVDRMWIFHPKGSIIFSVVSLVIISIFTIASFICNLLYNFSGLFSVQTVRIIILIFIFALSCTFFGLFTK